MADMAVETPVLRFTLSGLGSKWDGDYEYADLTFTNRELHTIKKLSGIRAGELVDALVAGDQDVAVALAFIALERNGTPIPERVLWDASSDFMEIHEEADDEEGDEQRDPLASTPDETPDDDVSSGLTSETSSDPNPTLPSGSGDQSSSTSD